MTQHILCIYDSKAEAYLAPFTANTLGLAERMFADLVNSPGHQFNNHPEDYTLFRIGTFDTNNAELVQAQQQSLATALSLLQGNLNGGQPD